MERSCDGMRGWRKWGIHESARIHTNLHDTKIGFHMLSFRPPLLPENSIVTERRRERGRRNFSSGSAWIAFNCGSFRLKSEMCVKVKARNLFGGLIRRAGATHRSSSLGRVEMTQ